MSLVGVVAVKSIKAAIGKKTKRGYQYRGPALAGRAAEAGRRCAVAQKQSGRLFGPGSKILALVSQKHSIAGFLPAQIALRTYP